MKAITIDGPVAAGKTSTADAVSKLLNIPAIRTGELFRALGHCIVTRMFASSQEELTELMQQGRLRPDFVVGNNKQTGIVLHNSDPDYNPVIPSDTLYRDPYLAMLASELSMNPTIRQALLDAERRVADAGPCIMEGRDIGTVVLPDAKVKIFLTAALDVRTDRRLTQQNLDPVKDFWPTLKAIRQRDSQDTYRMTAPLRAAADALVIDNSQLTLDETAAIIAALANARSIV